MSAFEHSTNWVVITGAPSSGKTSVIENLRARGYAVQAEVARELIEECLRRGLTAEDVRRDGGKQLQKDILRIKSEREASLDPSISVFMDRGMPDSMTYFRLAGLDVAMARQACMMFHYAAVFIFDRLPFVKDGIRVEDEAAAQKIDEMLRADYQSLGYRPTSVPVMSVAERSDFILQTLGLPLQVRAAS
jgi:predicted ATPase